MGLATLCHKKSSATETETKEITDIGEGSKTDQTTVPMTIRDEIQQQVSNPKADLLTPKTNIKIGCWYVRTTYQKMVEMVGPCVQNVVFSISQNSPSLDTSWKEELWSAKRNLEKYS